MQNPSTPKKPPAHFHHKRQKTLPFYLKSGLPDERFLEFRLFIHNRKANEVQHDLKFFEPLLSSQKPKKKSRSFSEYKENSLYKKKQRFYIENFTNGKVDIESTKISDSLDGLKQRFNGLKSTHAARLTRLVEKAMKKRKRSSASSRPKSGVPATRNLSAQSQARKPPTS